MVVWAGEKGPAKLTRQPVLGIGPVLAALQVSTSSLPAKANKKAQSDLHGCVAMSDCAFRLPL
jgi:hypothetical protein